MAKKKRKHRSQPVVMPKTDADMMKFTIHIDPTKVAIGHQPHISGTGVHGDRRTKRHRTRAAQRRRAVGEWE